MFRIRAEQIRALEVSTRRRYEGRMVAHLETFFGSQCKSLGPDRLRSAIRYGMDRARIHGFFREREVCKYIDLTFTFGRDFDTRPDFSWAPEILELNCRPSVKMSRLMGTALGEAGQAEGFDAEQGDTPFAPAVRLRQREFAAERSEEWIGRMSDLVRHYSREARYHRWDDSRDLRGPGHFEAILEVARRTPEIRHWLPTRAHDTVRKWLMTRPEILPDNLLVRIGASGPDTQPPAVAGFPTATIHESAPPMGEVCPNSGSASSCAPGSCGECRICWSAETRNVSFAPDRWPVRSERPAA